MAPTSWNVGSSGFDEEDRLVNWARNNGDSRTWNLSPVNDWTSMTISGASQIRSHSPTHEILTMAGADIAASLATLQHDKKGNMTVDERGSTMAWGFDNMLESFGPNQVNSVEEVSYEYDVTGRRVVKTVISENSSPKITISVPAGPQILCEYQLENTVSTCCRTYIYGGYVDEPLLFVDHTMPSNPEYYFHSNRQFSTYAISDQNGAIAEFYQYTPYGTHTSISSTGTFGGSTTVGNHDYTFTGRKFDIESALLDFRTRSYDSHAGRFISVDSEGYVDGMSLYSAYFAVSGLDPNGTRITARPIRNRRVSWREAKGPARYPNTGRPVRPRPGQPPSNWPRRRPWWPGANPNPNAPFVDPRPHPRLVPPNGPSGPIRPPVLFPGDPPSIGKPWWTKPVWHPGDPIDTNPVFMPDPGMIPQAIKKPPRIFEFPEMPDCDSPGWSEWHKCEDYDYDSMSDAFDDHYGEDYFVDSSNGEDGDAAFKCGDGQGDHWNVYSKERSRCKDHADKRGSIICCGCCDDSAGLGPQADYKCNAN